MRLTFYNSKVEKIAEAFNSLSVFWEVLYNDSGKCTISLANNSENRALTKDAMYVKLDIDKTHTPMVIFGHEINTQEIILHGQSCLWILLQRASKYKDGYKLPAALPANQIKVIFNSILPWGDAGKGNLVLGSLVSAGTARIRAMQGSSAGEQIMYLAQAHDIGIRFQIKEQNIEMSLFYPKLSDLLFSEKFGNVYDTKVIFSIVDAPTTVVVQADDINKKPTTVIVGNADIKGSLRREKALTESPQSESETSEEFLDRLNKAGYGALKSKPVKTISFNTSSTLYLGELIKVQLESAGVTAQARCMSVVVTVDKNEVHTTYSVGDTIIIGGI